VLHQREASPKALLPEEQLLRAQQSAVPSWWAAFPQEPLPVSPAAHYLMGGIETDLNGASTLEGLYASGECASSGVHGANRLASNSLLECFVFAHRAVAHGLAAELRAPIEPWWPVEPRWP